MWNGCCCTAILNTYVVALFCCCIAVTCTADKCYHLLRSYSFNTEDGADLFCYCSTADRTLVCRSFTFCDGCCQTITSWVTTATTVITWEACSDLYFFFIYFYFEFLTGCYQKESNNYTNYTNYQGSQ